VPVRLIENDQLGVIGAANWYLEHVSETGVSEQSA
jgi:glucokinase